MKIKTIAFDFGNVLGKFFPMKACKNLALFTDCFSQKIYEKIWDSGLERKLEEGGISPQQFYERVRQTIRANEKLTYGAFAELWGNIFDENKDIAQVLASFNPDIKIFIVSNTNLLHWLYIEKLPVIKNYFSDDGKRILSYRVGSMKPGRRIFDELIRKAECDVGEILFIDDILVNGQAFECLGGQRITYNCVTDSIESLQKELARFGVLRS